MTHEKRFRWHVIHDRIRDIPNPIGAEIGVHRGECSGHLLGMHPGLKLYMIDMWSPNTYKGKGDDAATGPYRKIYQEECELNFKIAKNIVYKFNERAEIIPLCSLEANELINFEELDFCFIDAAHDYESVKSDIIAWLPKVKKGGWMIFHDYGLFEGVTKAVDEMFDVVELDSDYIAAVRV